MRKYWLCLLLLVFVAKLDAQIITTIAGTGTVGFSGDGGAATAAVLNVPHAIAADAAGNIYFGDANNYRIRKITPAGTITTIAGNGTVGYSGDGGPATDAKLGTMAGLAIDAAGNIYVTDNSTYSSTVRKIDPSGIITTIAGGVSLGYSGDGGPATAAQLGTPRGIAIDAGDNIYIADGFRIRKISASGIITHFAGTGTMGLAGDGGPATAAAMNGVFGVATDATGNVYCATYGGSTPGFYIRKVNTAGIISTLAGLGPSGFSGDGGPATAAAITAVWLCVDSANNIYFGEQARIRKINPAGIVSTIAGTGSVGFSGDSCASILADMTPHGIADYGGAIYVCDGNNYRIRKIYHDSVPFFSSATHNINVCGGTTFALNSLLAVTDGDLAQAINWSVLTAPFHGTLLATYSTTTTGGAITPSGLSYTPFTSYFGTDTFSVIVTDCGNETDTTSVYVTIDSVASAGSISGIDSICPGDTATLSASIGGGSWSSSNASIASVGTTGLLTGIGGGVVTITYTVTNGCGTATTTHLLIVKPASACPSGFYSPLVLQKDILSVFPNPVQGCSFTIYVSAVTNEEVYIAISNMVGEKIKEFATVANKQEDVQLAVPSGIYFINATTMQGVWNKRLVVIK